MATRSKAELIVVSRPAISYSPCWRKTCKAQALSLPLLQAGRYMAEYRAVRKKHSILEICKTPEIAAEVTITAAERLDVDAAIIFADLLLPLEVMGMPFRFEAGEGPVIERPLRAQKDIDALVTNRSAELGYVAESVRLVVKHFGDKQIGRASCRERV